jgi:hypothetical protein
MSHEHKFTSELPEFPLFDEYAKTKLTGADLEYFIAGQGPEAELTEEYKLKHVELYNTWLTEFKITHTISEGDTIVFEAKHTDF